MKRSSTHPKARGNARTLISETPEHLADRVAQDVVALVDRVLQHQDRFTLVLSGGRTPQRLYARLAQEPYRSSLPWARLWMFWGDERCVPPDHPDSNFHQVHEALLRHQSPPSAHIFRMRGEEDPLMAALDYETRLRAVFPKQPWPCFDLVLLGMGSEGHTASLVAGSPALQSGERWVVPSTVSWQPTQRLTMTLPVFNHAQQVWFLVTGAEKRKALALAQQKPDERYPASLVRPETGDVRWYTDF